MSLLRPTSQPHLILPDPGQRVTNDIITALIVTEPLQRDRACSRNYIVITVASMTVRTKIVKIGNSQGIRIAKPLLEQADISDDVELEVRDGSIIIHAVRSVREGLRRGLREDG